MNVYFIVRRQVKTWLSFAHIQQALSMNKITGYSFTPPCNNTSHVKHFHQSSQLCCKSRSPTCKSSRQFFQSPTSNHRLMSQSTFKASYTKKLYDVSKHHVWLWPQASWREFPCYPPCYTWLNSPDRFLLMLLMSDHKYLKLLLCSDLLTNSGWRDLPSRCSILAANSVENQTSALEDPQ